MIDRRQTTKAETVIALNAIWNIAAALKRQDCRLEAHCARQLGHHLHEALSQLDWNEPVPFVPDDMPTLFIDRHEGR